MSGPKGKLIVIEGTDGSGKKTQTKLLMDWLQVEGYKAITISFPQYGKKSAGLVEEYLNGKYGKAEEVSPYTASLFFALDRFDFSQELKRLLNESYIVILDRYVDSNAGHQGGKIKDQREREKFIEWLYDIEYRVLGIPRPDFTVVLHVPAEIGHGFVAKKQQRLYLEGGKTHDAHESNLEHLRAAEASYLWLSQKFPEDHIVIECVESGKMLSPEEVHQKIREKLSKLIAKK